MIIPIVVSPAIAGTHIDALADALVWVLADALVYIPADAPLEVASARRDAAKYPDKGIAGSGS